MLKNENNWKFMQASEADREEILQLYRSLVGTECCAWSQEYPGEEQIRGDLSRKELFCLKEADGTIVGTISIDDDPEVEALECWSPQLKPSRELSRLGVRISHQNRGIARLLLQYGMEELRKRGCKGVHFLVCKTNGKAIRSYEKLQFAVVGECKLFGEQFWCYEKCLEK